MLQYLNYYYYYYYSFIHSFIQTTSPFLIGSDPPANSILHDQLALTNFG